MSQPLYDPSPLVSDHSHAVMAAGTDLEAVDETGSSADVKSHSTPAQSTHTSMSHYLGLPYQDHNYGAPPPPTPPQSPPPIIDCKPVLPFTSVFDNSNSNITPPEDNADSVKDEGVTRCICNYDHDDGYMICCDRCLVWQHVECMGLDRNNIPDVYFCDKCEPRPVDQKKAIELQTLKLKHFLDKRESSDDDRHRSSKKTRYAAISNTPTSLTLTTTTKTKNKLKKKKKKKEKEKEKDREKETDKEKRQENRHHKKKKKKKRKHRRNKEDGHTGIRLDKSLHGDQQRENTDQFVEATANQYSAELNQFLFTQRQSSSWSMPGLGCIMDDLSPQKIQLGSVGRTARGLVATEELAANQPIVEYRGMLMLRDQFVPSNGWTKKPYLHVLVYTKFSNIELCVDARKYGNIARFVRKSCSPNAEVRHVAIDGLLRLYLFSLVEISKGTEVTVGFDFSYKDCSHPVKCACSRKNCPVKRYWRKQRSLEARSHKKPSNGQETAPAPPKRTVSPLRVSLTAANNAENRVEPVIRSIEPPQLIKVETPPVTAPSQIPTQPPGQEKTPKQEPTQETKPDMQVQVSDPDHKEKVDVVAVDSSTQSAQASGDHQESAVVEHEEPQPARKLTREERKMEAIMKAFAKMEKTQKRRQQALERIAQTKQHDAVSGGQAGKGDDHGTSAGAHQPGTGTAGHESGQSGQISQSDSGKEEKDFSKTSETPSKDESSSNTVTPVTTRSRTNRRKRKGAKSRRSRVNSLTNISVDASSADDDSNQASALGHYPSCPTTPTAAVNPLTISTSFGSQEKVDSGLGSPGASSSKRFRFPKTKKFFMNEWLNEKALESSASKPLTIKTEQLDLSYAGTMSSPNTPVLQRSGSLTTLCRESRNNSLDSSSGLGSAKKRWLRQAMSEGNSNQEAPLCNGTLSPTPSPALSPNTIASSDIMTPLKKRMLRHSLAEESPYGGSSPKYESKQVQDTTLSSAGSDAVPSDDAPILIEAKKDLETVQEEDVRKNSSIDSGLSVTTPAELEKSPTAGLEERLKDFSRADVISQQSVSDSSKNDGPESKVDPQECLSDSNANILARDKNSKNEQKIVDNSGPESTPEKLLENDVNTVDKASEKPRDEADGDVSAKTEERTITPVTEKVVESSATTLDDVASLKDSPTGRGTLPHEVASKSSDPSLPAVPEELKRDDRVSRSDELRARFLANTKSEIQDSYVNSPRTRHVSGPGAMQGYRDTTGPLTLNTTFYDDHMPANSNLYTPFSPKKRLLRQNTDPSEQRDAGQASMASSWPQQSFGSQHAYTGRPKEESNGPNQQAELFQKNSAVPVVQASSSNVPQHGDIKNASTPTNLSAPPPSGNLSASWSPGLRPGHLVNGGSAPPRTPDLSQSASGSLSSGTPKVSPPPGILKTSIPPNSAVRNLGSSLSAASGAIQESSDADAQAPTSGSSSASSSAQSTPVKKKVSLHEYRKRRGSSAKPTSSSSSTSSGTSTSTTITASLVGTTTSGSSTKLPLITLPNIPLPDIPASNPLKNDSKKPVKSTTSPPSGTNTPVKNTPVKSSLKVGGSPRRGENGSSGKTPAPTKPATPPGMAIISTKIADGQNPTLTLTSEAQQVINSFTTMLMEETHVNNGDIKDRNIRRSDSAPGDSRYVRRNHQDKPWEKDGRGDATTGLKRPLSPEPPPPPPGKKLCPGLPPHVPPPPPPKGKGPADVRPAESGPILTHRQNSLPGSPASTTLATNSPIKNVTGNAMPQSGTTQYGIAHQTQRQTYPVQFPQQQQQQPFAPNSYHQQQPQQQAPQQPVPPRPGLPAGQKLGNFNYPYGSQTTENANTQGFPQQQRGNYPHMSYRPGQNVSNQNQHNNHYGLQNKFPPSGRKSPYGSQDSGRQHTYYGRSNSSNAYSPRKNFPAQ